MKLIPIAKGGKISKNIPSSDYTNSICDSMEKLYEKKGFNPPWIGYFLVKENRVVGTCAFKSKPFQGKVEIAYFTFPEYEGKGYGSKMVLSLIEIALKTNPSIRIIAQTLPEKNASTHILRKLEFVYHGEYFHPEDGKIWKWEYKK